MQSYNIELNIQQLLQVNPEHEFTKDKTVTPKQQSRELEDGKVVKRWCVDVLVKDADDNLSIEQIKFWADKAPEPSMTPPAVQGLRLIVWENNGSRGVSFSAESVTTSSVAAPLSDSGVKAKNSKKEPFVTA